MKTLNITALVVAITFVSTTVFAEKKIIEIPYSNSAYIWADGNWDCCSMDNISVNPSTIYSKNCEVLGGYCMGGKRWGVWAFENPNLPEGSTILTAAFKGQRGGAYGSGYLKTLGSEYENISTSGSSQLWQSGLNQNINWPSGASFTINLPASALNALTTNNFLMVGAYKSGTTSMTINNTGTSPYLYLLVDVPSEECEGDVNLDGQVNVHDVLQVIGAWGDCSTKQCDEDITGDYVVDVADLLTLIDNWGQCE